MRIEHIEYSGILPEQAAQMMDMALEVADAIMTVMESIQAMVDFECSTGKRRSAPYSNGSTTLLCSQPRT